MRGQLSFNSPGHAVYTLRANAWRVFLRTCIMYLLYLDDSGSVANPEEAYFVLGGIAMHEKKVYWINKHLDALADACSPGLGAGLEFHATEIFSGRKPPWKQMDRPRRIEVLKQVLSTARQEARDTALFACAIHKGSFRGQDPVAMAFEEICSRFNLFLQRMYHVRGESHQGIVILDESAHETSLQQLARNFRTLGTRWRVTKNLQEVPLFVDSRASRGIQLADHVAYAVFRRYNAEDISYYNVIEDLFDRDGEKLHGLVHRQTVKACCTCPACISRQLGPAREDAP